MLSMTSSAFCVYPVSLAVPNKGRGCQRAVRSFTALHGRLRQLVKQALAVTLTCPQRMHPHAFVTTSPGGWGRQQSEMKRKDARGAAVMNCDSLCSDR